MKFIRMRYLNGPYIMGGCYFRQPESKLAYERGPFANIDIKEDDGYGTEDTMRFVRGAQNFYFDFLLCSTK